MFRVCETGLLAFQSARASVSSADCSATFLSKCLWAALCCMQTACPLLCRGVPQPASLPAEPIALLDDMDTGMPFSSAPAAQQQQAQDSKLEGSGKKPKKEKHKKESKEKKHKKHKKEKEEQTRCATSFSMPMRLSSPPLPACKMARHHCCLYLMNLHFLNILYGQVLHD